MSSNLLPDSREPNQSKKAKEQAQKVAKTEKEIAANRLIVSKYDNYLSKLEKETLKISMNIEAESQGGSSCDLRGMNSEEAETKMEAFISHAIVTKIPRVTIIHGHGMGTIKTLVKNYLEKTGICKQFSPGRRGEGGTGVTVVEF